jgi:hypothetical protein
MVDALPPDGCGLPKWNEHARDPPLIAKTAGPKVYSRVPTVFHHPGQVPSLQEMVVDSHPAKPPPNSPLQAQGTAGSRKVPPKSPGEAETHHTHPTNNYMS